MANRAVCVGINDYPGTNSDLSGCVNDAGDYERVFRSKFYAHETLSDSDAEKRNITSALDWLVRSTRYGETGVFTFSGHGTWIPDLDNDEPDRRDEALCPYDIQDGKLITDDEIARIFSAKRYGARIIMISDSCHSGTVQRLMGSISGSRNKIRFLPPSVFLDGRALKRAEETPPTLRSRSKAKVRANVSLLMSGCQDWEYSYDAWFGDRANGAFTYVALAAYQAMTEGGSYANWMDLIRSTLPSQDFPQTPQLSGRLYMRRWGALA